jgi:hypothetical protein
MLALPRNINPLPERVCESSWLAQINVGVTGRLVVTVPPHCQQVVVVDYIVEPRPGGAPGNLTTSLANVEVSPCRL